MANAQGRPIAFVLTSGNVADISVAADLLEEIAPPQRLLADKAYDADHLRHRLERQGTEVVIPSTATRRKPYPLNQRAYRRRNVIERMFWPAAGLVDTEIRFFNRIGVPDAATSVQQRVQA